MDGAELKRDLDEFKRLIQLTTRQNVRSILQGHIDELQKSVEDKRVEEQHQSGNGDIAPSQDSPKKQTKLPLKKITSYAWDQSDQFVKIYATSLAGVQAIPSDNVTCSFSTVGFNLMICGLSGKDHQLQITSLYDKISPDDSKIKVKSDSVLIMLKKSTKGRWEGITEMDRKKAEKKKAEITPKADEDPQAGIMNMMKKMYEEGDDDMKRTIAKAWTESQDKKAAGMDSF